MSVAAPDPRGDLSGVRQETWSPRDHPSPMGFGPAGEAQRHDTRWTQHVIVRDNHIRILVNGTEVVNFVDADRTHADGHLALLHYLPGSMVQFRNVMMRRFSPTP